MTKAVFFDLDGTLADTAPDFAAVLHRLQTEEGLPSTPYPALRTHVSHGIRGMLSIGFGVSPEMDCYPSLAQRFLDYYTEALCVRTQLFEGIADLLHALECQGITWRIVTNKPERLATPLVHALGLSERTACIIGGDTAPRAKPYPDPLLHACRICGISPETSPMISGTLTLEGLPECVRLRRPTAILARAHQSMIGVPTQSFNIQCKSWITSDERSWYSAELICACGLLISVTWG